MGVTALCNIPFIKLLLLLAAHAHHNDAQKSDTAFIHVVPTRLQFFEYESISFTCEASDGSPDWRRVRNAEGYIQTCSHDALSSTLTCTIENAFVSDSGEYWCEAGGGERSSSVSITVTAGDLILESPVLPVMEGEQVILCCSRKAAPSNSTADFFKDGLSIGIGYSGKMTISSVSKSDEGLYKCIISGAGESPESRMTVIKSFTEQKEEGGLVILESPALPVTEGDNVTLRCRSKTSSIILPAVFYKDGLFIGSSSTGNLYIQYVYKTHEGLYRCNISEVGESAGSWLTVRALQREASLFSDNFIVILLLSRTVFTIVMVALQLLLIGLLQCGKLGVKRK